MRQVIIEVPLEDLHYRLGLPYSVVIKGVALEDSIVRIKLEADKFLLVPDGKPIPTAKMHCHTKISFRAEEKINEGS